MSLGAPTPPRPHSWLRRHARWIWLGAFVLFAPAPVRWAGLAVLAGGLVAVRGPRVLGWARRAGGRATPSPARERRRGPAVVELGVDGHGAAVRLLSEQLRAHGLVLGASGSGKSTTLLSIGGQQIAHGQGLVAVDLKGSAEFAEQLALAAAISGRRLRVWTPDGDLHWNPLAHGNPTELKDKLISTERFSEPHYKRAAERYVQLAFQVLAETDPAREPSLARLVRVLDPARLEQLSRRLGPDRRLQVQEYLGGLTRDQLSAVRGLESRLAVITESHTGPFLEPGPDGIDLRRALDGEEVVLFSLNSSTYGQLSAQLGSLVVQDLVSATGARERRALSGERPTAATVLLDEFSALGSDHVMGLIARGRSAGVSVLLATQELADLDRVSRGFRQQVLGSTAVKIAHRQDVSESALEVARLSGSQRVWEQSYSEPDGLLARLAGGSGAGVGRNGRRVHRQVVERPNVDPSTVQSLRTGEAVIITKAPQAETRLARIRPLGLDGGSRSEPGRGR